MVSILLENVSIDFPFFAVVISLTNQDIEPDFKN